MSGLLKLKLAQLNRLRFARPRPDARWQVTLDEEVELRRLELAWIENQRAPIVQRAHAVPRDPGAFVTWFESLAGPRDPLFPWLAEHATLDQMSWFLRQQGPAKSWDADEIVWESTALANLVAGLAANRRYAYQSIGANAAGELVASGRTELVNAGLARLGLATLAAATWNRDAVVAVVSEDNSLAPLIAEGALMRLAADAACFARYRGELSVDRVRAA